jgi:hypothetical protein
MWDKDFLLTDKNWHMDTFSSAPYIIAIKYRTLYNMVKSSEFYGAFFTIKDLFEIIIKYYSLCACAISVKDNNEVIVKMLCNPIKSMSLGDWVNTLTTEEIRFYGKQSLWGRLLSQLRHFYNENNIVRWRNDNIGHGALASADDQEFIQDIQEKIILLKELLRHLEEYFHQIRLEQDGVTLAGELAKPINDHELTVSFKSSQVSLFPFVHVEKGQLWFYDSMDRHGMIKIIDYQNGKRVPWINSYFTGLRKKYYSTLNIMEKGDLSATFYKRSLDNALDAYYKEDNYHKQTYMLNWLKESMEKHDKGVLLLNTEQGTGKSTFSYALDELGGHKLTIPNTVIRTYYCNRTSIRTVEDFTTSISRIFLANKDSAIDFRYQYEGSMPGISLKDKERSASMVNLLKICHDIHSREYGKDRILLILDGVDELNIQALSILSFIPEPNRLPDGVYILMTCRSDSIPAPMLLSFLQRFPFTESVQFHRKNENRELLINAIDRIYKRKNINIDNIYLEQLADQLDNRFSYVKILECAVDNGIDILNANQKEMIEKYLSMLRGYYGEVYHRAFLRLLAVIVIAEHPLTMKEAAFMASGENLELRDLAFLYDMKPLLVPYHDIFGGLLLWSNNEELEGYIQDKFYDIITECIEMWEEMICIYRDSYPSERDGYGYICAHFISAKKKYFREWVNSSSSERNMQLMESINSYAVVYGYQNDQYYVKERCRLMLESIEKFISNENVQYPETLKEGMYLVSKINKFPLLVDSNDLKAVALLEKQVNQYFDGLNRDRKSDLSVKLLMFKFYADSFTFHANQRNISKADEYYKLAQELNIAANFASQRVLQLNYINFLKDMNPASCLNLVNEILLKPEEYSNTDIARVRYNQGVAYDALKGNGKNIKPEYILQCYDEGLKVIEDAVLCPQNLWVNMIQSLLLTAKSKCYRKWLHNYDEAIKVNDRAVGILQFHSNVGNVVDLANILLAMHESCLLRQIRNLAGDKEDALNIATDAIKLFEMSNQSINCILIGNIYIAYANSLYDLNGDINEIVRAWEQATRYYKMAGMDDSHEEIKKMKYNLQLMKDKVN